MVVEKVHVVSGDLYSFEVDALVASQLPNYEKWMKGDRKGDRLELFVLEGINHHKMLKWLDYCKILASPECSAISKQVFVNQFDAIGLLRMIQDAHKHKFKSLMYSTCGALANKVNGKTYEEIIKEFAINQGQKSFDNSVAKLVNRLILIVEAPVVAYEDQQGLSQGLMRSPERSSFTRCPTFMDFYDPYLLHKIPGPERRTYIRNSTFMAFDDPDLSHEIPEIPDPEVPHFGACITDFMISSEFLQSKKFVLSSNHGKIRKLLEAAKRLQQSIDGDPRPFLKIGLNVDVSERLIQILQTETFEMQKIQCAAASILSRALVYSKFKLACKAKDAFIVVEKGIPVVVNLMLSNYVPLLKEVVNTLAYYIIDYPRCVKVILDSGALEAAQKIVSGCNEDEVVCSLARFLLVVCFYNNLDLNSDQEHTILEIIKDIYRIPYSSCKLTATYALGYLSYGKCVAIEETVMKRLVEFISLSSFTYAGLNDTAFAESAIAVVGNIVRWGNSDQIKYLKNECKLLQCLGAGLTFCQVKMFRLEACRIISNLAAQSDTRIEDLDASKSKEAVCKLLLADDCDVQLEAAWAIYGLVYGYELKQLATVFEDEDVYSEYSILASVEEAAKIDLFEDDDEFEIGLEFEEKNEIGVDVTQEWEDDWDDDDVNDDFSVQLKKELQNDPTEKK